MRPVLLRHGLAHDGDARRGGAVRVSEVASAAQRYADGGHVSGAYANELDSLILATGGIGRFDPDCGRKVRLKRKRSQSRELYAGLSAERGKQRIEQTRRII